MKKIVEENIPVDGKQFFDYKFFFFGDYRG